MPHYENVPFEIPSSWAWTTLGHIGIWQSGGTPSRSNKSYYGGNIPWLKTGDLNDGLITDIPENITEEAVANSSAKLNPVGSVLIAMYGATIGKLGILTFPATTNQACCACIQYDAVIQDYLFYFLLSQRNEFIAKGGGGAQPNISKEIIVGTMVPIPPLAEQERIACEIKRWFALIEQIEQGKADLQTAIKQTKSKILDLAIHGKLVPQDPNDEPASDLLKRINLKAEITCDNGQYGKMPKGWYLCLFGEYLDVRDGTHDSPKYVDKGYPFVTSKNLNNGKIDFDTVKFISEEDHMKFSQRSFVEDGDILFAMIGSIGNPVLVVKNREFSIKNVALFKPYDRKNTYMEYVLYYLFYIQETLKLNAKGGMQPFIPLSYFRKDLHLPLPPIAEQHRIVAKIEELFNLLDQIEKSLEA